MGYKPRHRDIVALSAPLSTTEHHPLTQQSRNLLVSTRRSGLMGRTTSASQR